MTWFADMGGVSMAAAGDHVRAVGWLHPDHPYPRGAVPAEFAARLREFARLAGHCVEALGFGMFRGVHACEFCRPRLPPGRARGSLNFGVPAAELLYVAPEMVAHYVDAHGYAPPPEFVAAVLASPLPGTPEYAAAVENFRRIHLGRSGIG